VEWKNSVLVGKVNELNKGKQGGRWLEEFNELKKYYLKYTISIVNYK
jgi:hypothetical protein